MKQVLTFALPLLGVLLGSPTSSQASDHIDGMKTAIDHAADITDVFTFISPENPDKLVLIMNVHGLAFSRSRFSNAVDYTFRIRPIDDVKTLKPSTDTKKEQSVVCSFEGGHLLVEPKQHATCKFDLGGAIETVSFDTRSKDHKAGGSGEKGGLRVFAGVRSEPWFVDLARLLKYNNGLKVDGTSGINGLNGQNVLSIVVEVDRKRLSGPLLAVTGETARK